MIEYQWNIEFSEHAIKSSSIKISKIPNLNDPLYQIFFEQRFGEFISVTIIYICCTRFCFWNVIDENRKLTLKTFNKALSKCIQAKYLLGSRAAVIS